jgi:ligand-binding sensor domain-containing protein
MSIGKLNTETGAVVEIDLKEKIDKSTLKFLKGRLHDHLTPDPCVFPNFFKCENQNIYIRCINNGVYLLNETTETLLMLNAKSCNYSWTVTDGSNRIWFISKSCVGIFNKSTGAIAVTDKRATKLNNITDIGHFLGDNGNIWLLRYSGIAKLNVETGRVNSIEYKNDQLDTGGCLGFKAPDGSCWIATWNGDLARLNEEDGTFAITSRVADLLRGYSFVDTKGSVWLCSHHGIGVLDTSTGHLEITDKADYSSASMAIDSNGKHWLATSKGYGIFDIENGKLELHYCNESSKKTAVSNFVNGKTGIWCFTGRN